MNQDSQCCHCERSEAISSDVEGVRGYIPSNQRHRPALVVPPALCLHEIAASACGLLAMTRTRTVSVVIASAAKQSRRT
jgi:hypothetical protein